MATIPLTKNKIAIVDEDMLEFLSQKKWFVSSTGNGYAKTAFKRNKQMAMHHVVAGYPLKGMVIDHINGNSLDNRRINLRVVTIRQNLLNKKMHRNGRLAGVHYSKHKKSRLHPWRSEIYANGKRYWLGSFGSAVEAHMAYLNALNKLGVK